MAETYDHLQNLACKCDLTWGTLFRSRLHGSRRHQADKLAADPPYATRWHRPHAGSFIKVKILEDDRWVAYDAGVDRKSLDRHRGGMEPFPNGMQ